MNDRVTNKGAGLWMSFKSPVLHLGLLVVLGWQSAVRLTLILTGTLLVDAGLELQDIAWIRGGVSMGVGFVTNLAASWLARKVGLGPLLHGAAMLFIAGCLAHLIWIWGWVTSTEALVAIQLGTIVFTGAKREEKLLIFPGQVAIVDADDLNGRTVRNVSELDRVFGGVSIDSRGSRVNTNISVRGQPSLDFYNPSMQLDVDGIPQDAGRLGHSRQPAPRTASRTKQRLRFKQSEYRPALSGKATTTRITLFANVLEVVEIKDDFTALYVDDCTSLEACVQRLKVSKQGSRDARYAESAGPFKQNRKSMPHSSNL